METAWGRSVATLLLLGLSVSDRFRLILQKTLDDIEWQSYAIQKH